MGKRKDLSEFDKGQIVMARRLGQSISKTAALVGCSRSAVVSIYQKCSKEGTVVNRRQGHGRPRLIDACVVRSNRRATVAQIAQEVNAGSDRKVSEYTVCCVWGCIATDQSGCPCWPLSMPRRDMLRTTTRSQTPKALFRAYIHACAYKYKLMCVYKWRQQAEPKPLCFAARRSSRQQVEERGVLCCSFMFTVTLNHRELSLPSTPDEQLALHTPAVRTGACLSSTGFSICLHTQDLPVI